MDMLDIRYPHVKVKLIGTDGNAFAIMGAVIAALRRAKVSSKEIDSFCKEATGGDYNNLLATCFKWVDVR